MAVKKRIKKVEKKTVEVNPIDLAIGAAIKQARLAGGLSMKDLGEMLKPPITFQQIQKYECGTNRTASSTLVAIAGALNVPVAALLTGVDLDKVPDYGDATTARFVKSYQSLPSEDNKAAIRNLVAALAKEAVARFSSARTRAAR